MRAARHSRLIQEAAQDPKVDPDRLEIVDLVDRVDGGRHGWRSDLAEPVHRAELSAIANAMARTYITNEHWYRVPETWWHGVADATPSGPAPTALWRSACSTS